MGAGRVDGLGQAGRVGRLDVAAATLSGGISDSTVKNAFYVVVGFRCFAYKPVELNGKIR